MPARQPFQISAYHPSLRERIAQGAGSLAEAFGIGRYGQQYVTDRVGTLLDFVPAVGEAIGADEVRRDVRNHHYGSAAIGTLALLAGAVPVVGDEAAKLLRSARNPAKKLASRTARIYDPPVRPARNFTDDYPNGAATDEAGRLRTDIEGRPLGARYIVGRTQAAGRDVALPGEALDPVAEALTGSGLRLLPQSAVGRSRVGFVSVDRRSGRPTQIGISRALRPEETARVARYEAGHAVDQIAGNVPADGLSDELRRVYNDLNNPQSHGCSFGPEQHGYKDADVPRELMAEAIRAYMTDPNYLKTVAPKTAARIRAFVNANPRLKSVIQFNSPAAASIAAGALAYDIARPDTDEASRRDNIADFYVQQRGGVAGAAGVGLRSIY